MKILLTGAAGFIGMHVAQRLLARGDEVLGLDNLNDYYDPALKHARLAQLTPYPNFTDVRLDIADRAGIAELFDREKPQRVVNLAAEIDGFPGEDHTLETLWRDMEGQSFARMADALLKLKELNVPAQGLWTMIPGITSTQVKQWQDLIDEDPDQILSAAIAKASKPDGSSSQTQDVQQANADPELE